MSDSTGRDILYLQTDAQDIVWFCRHGGSVECSTYRTKEFVQSKLFLGAQQIRLLGTPGNANLITSIYANTEMDKVAQIGCPAMCRWPDSFDPMVGLPATRQPSAALLVQSSWHPMIYADWITYRMVQVLADRNDDYLRLLGSFLMQHPAGLAVSFIPTHSILCACELITMIRDPRWFNHMDHPARISRLLAHLDVTTHGFRMNNHGAYTALTAWHGHKTSVDIDLPANFLRRVQQRAGSAGLFKATKTFIEFMRLVWLDRIIGTPENMLFDPERFFKTTDEVAAYLRHRANFNAVTGSDLQS